MRGSLAGSKGPRRSGDVWEIEDRAARRGLRVDRQRYPDRPERAAANEGERQDVLARRRDVESKGLLHLGPLREGDVHRVRLPRSKRERRAPSAIRCVLRAARSVGKREASEYREVLRARFPIVDIDQDRCRRVFGEIVREAGLRPVRTEHVQRRRSRGRGGRDDDRDNDEGPDEEHRDDGPERPVRREGAGDSAGGRNDLRGKTFPLPLSEDRGRRAEEKRFERDDEAERGRREGNAPDRQEDGGEHRERDGEPDAEEDPVSEGKSPPGPPEDMSQRITRDEKNEKETEDSADTSTSVDSPERSRRRGDDRASDEVSIPQVTTARNRAQIGLLDAQRRGNGRPRYALLPLARRSSIAAVRGYVPSSEASYGTVPPINRHGRIRVDDRERRVLREILDLERLQRSRSERREADRARHVDVCDDDVAGEKPVSEVQVATQHACIEQRERRPVLRRNIKPRGAAERILHELVSVNQGSGIDVV